MKRVLMSFISLFICIFAFTNCGYNTSIEMEETVKESWSQIEVQLKRRYDLIPNLIETVKGYATHERGLLTDIANARKAYFQSNSRNEKIANSQKLEGMLSRLLLLKETYPNLKANQSFLKLQDTLEGTENRIAVARKRYNTSVKELNSYIRGIPGKWWAEMTGVVKAEYYEIKEAEKAVPKVKF